MILGMGRREQVVRDPNALEQLKKAVVILLIHFLDGFALSIRRQRDGRPVRISPTDHQDLVALESMVACDNITRQMGAGNVSYMYFCIGVRPGNCNQDIFGHSCLHILCRGGQLGEAASTEIDKQKGRPRNWDSLYIQYRKN